MSVSLSVAVMAHPKRRHFVAELTAALDVEAPVVWDERNDRWDTGRRSLLAHDPQASHHLVVQDDAVVCRDLAAAAARAAEAAGERPVALYTGRVRPYRARVAQAIEGARAAGATWLEMEGPWWGVALVIPTAHIPDLVAWGDGRPDVPNYDKRIARWYGHQGIACWYSIPSLVDHRSVAENPSLVPGRTGDRHAHCFIGHGSSGLDVEWSTWAFRAAQEERDLRRQVREARRDQKIQARRLRLEARAARAARPRVVSADAGAGNTG
ncbi:hypothetical protein [Streptomyces aidingensis]|uniref:Glycosyltransferase n=1 Tax=Streptomyces aidingensis TaxID=910347 RepID=A0A1I1PWU2_9ACTN|nr:hypothetical protein [Streptomyces aidingensis]SFD14356.1 hypothetical protein SAMN05421773_110111 [Streptomyces aidingensis]